MLSTNVLTWTNFSLITSLGTYLSTITGVGTWTGTMIYLIQGTAVSIWTATAYWWTLFYIIIFSTMYGSGLITYIFSVCIAITYFVRLTIWGSYWMRLLTSV